MQNLPVIHHPLGFPALNLNLEWCKKLPLLNISFQSYIFPCAATRKRQPRFLTKRDNLKKSKNKIKLKVMDP